MDYSQYTVLPQFSGKQAAQVQRIKKFLGNNHSHNSKERMREKLAQLYHSRAKSRAGYDNPVYGSGSMSNKAIDQQVVSGVRSKFGNEIDASAARQAQIAKYYDDWNTQLQGIKDSQAQAAQAAIDATNNAQTNTSKNEQDANSQLLSQMQNDAASRGATVDPSLFIKANQASANRASLVNTQAATMGAVKNANSAYYAEQGLINAASRQGALDKERSYTSKLRSDASDYATALRKELDQASFDRAISYKTLGLKEKAQNWAMSPNNPSNQPSSSGGSGGSGGSSGSGFTPTQIRNSQQEYRKIRGQASAALTTIDPDTKKPILTGGGAAAQAYINALVAKGTDPLMAEAAVLDALQQHHKSSRRDPGLAKKIHKAYGFKIHIG